MTLRGKVAIVGIGEVPTRRSYPGRTLYGLCADAARQAIVDAGLTKDDLNGLVTDGVAAPPTMAEYIGIRPTFATGVSMHQVPDLDAAGEHEDRQHKVVDHVHAEHGGQHRLPV